MTSLIWWRDKSEPRAGGFGRLVMAGGCKNNFRIKHRRSVHPEYGDGGVPQPDMVQSETCWTARIYSTRNRLPFVCVTFMSTLTRCRFMGIPSSASLHWKTDDSCGVGSNPGYGMWLENVQEVDGGSAPSTANSRNGQSQLLCKNDSAMGDEKGFVHQMLLLTGGPPSCATAGIIHVSLRGSYGGAVVVLVVDHLSSVFSYTAPNAMTFNI